MYRPRRPQEYLPADEIYHTYTLIVWQGVCAVFHSGLLNFGDLESVLFLSFVRSIHFGSFVSYDPTAECRLCRLCKVCLQFDHLVLGILPQCSEAGAAEQRVVKQTGRAKRTVRQEQSRRDIRHNKRQEEPGTTYCGKLEVE